MLFYFVYSGWGICDNWLERNSKLGDFLGFVIGFDDLLVVYWLWRVKLKDFDETYLVLDCGSLKTGLFHVLVW